jgi:hypothetical protein
MLQGGIVLPNKVEKVAGLITKAGRGIVRAATGNLWSPPILRDASRDTRRYARRNFRSGAKLLLNGTGRAGKARGQLCGSHARFAHSRADPRWDRARHLPCELGEQLGIVCIGQVDLAFDHMPQVSSFAVQDHFDLEFSLSSKLLLTHHPFDCYSD